MFGERNAATLKRSEIEDWLDAIQEKRDLENSTIYRMRCTFSMIYRHGRRKDRVVVNPAADVPLREVGNWKERFLSIEEEKRLRAVLQRQIDSHDPLLHPELRKQAIHRLLVFEVSLKSGIRRLEQCTLRWEDVDFDRRLMRLRKTKNGRPRNAFIIEDGAAALKQLGELNLEPRSIQRSA